MKYVQVQVFEPAKNSKLYPDLSPKLDDMLCHPARYRYIDCYTNTEGQVRILGAEGWWDFRDGRCNNFAMLGPAKIIKEYPDDIDASALGSDTFETAEGDALFFRVALSGGESSGFSPSAIEKIIRQHQQQLADELGKGMSWGTAVTGYFRELETEFRNLAQDAYFHCQRIENDTVLPSED